MEFGRLLAENFPDFGLAWHAMSVNSTGPAGHRLGAWLAALAPLGAALFHAVDSPLLRSDASRAARGGGEALLQGSPSLWLGRLFEALPFGAQASRATLLGALCAGCAGLFTYLLARDATARKTAPTALEPWFALAMTWSALLGASWLDESSVVSGAAPAAALGLGLWWEVRRGLRLPLPLVGAAFGVLLAESAWVGAALALTVSFEPALRRREGYLGALTGLLLALGACFGALMAAGDPFPWARDTAVSFGEAFPWGAAGFFAELGLLPTLAGGGAIVLLLLRRWSRKWTLREPRNWALLVPILLDLTLPLAGGTGLLQTPAPTARLGLHLFALASAACLANIGLCAVSEAARGWQLYGASAARPLLAALGLASALAGAETAFDARSQVPLDRPRALTDASLGTLPARTLVLLRSETLIRRFVVAQVEHERPDVLLVPLAWLGQPRWMRSLLEREPRLEQLIRDLNVAGTPSEHALDLLADVRPVYVEPDPSWDRRLLEHLAPAPVLSRFAPTALGRSDRLAAWDRSVGQLGEWLEPRGERPVDPTVAALVTERLAALQAALNRAGDTKAASWVAARASSQAVAAATATPATATSTAPTAAARDSQRTALR